LRWLSQVALLKPDESESEGCSSVRVSGGRTIRLCLSWPSDSEGGLRNARSSYTWPTGLQWSGVHTTCLFAKPKLLGGTIIYASTPSMGEQCPLWVRVWDRAWVGFEFARNRRAYCLPSICIFPMYMKTKKIQHKKEELSVRACPLWGAAHATSPRFVFFCYEVSKCLRSKKSKNSSPITTALPLFCPHTSRSEVLP
jgi:hypothetical protein